MLGAIASLGGSVLSGLFGSKSASDNIKYQKQFAQQGIQWKVADAKKAGIHPLAALGAQTHSFSPVQGGDWSGLASAGQDLGRAIEARSTKGQRLDAYSAETQKLAIDRGRLENDILRAELASKLAKVKQPGNPPAVADSQNPNLLLGQGDSPGINNKAMERQGWKAGSPQQEAGAVSDHGFTRTSQGWAPVMSKDAKDRLEEDLPGMIWWNIRNRVIEPMRQNRSVPYQAPVGSTWQYNPISGEYVLRKKYKPSTRKYY